MTSPTSSPLLILVSAPSGGGKTTLCEQILATNPQTVRVVTCTTRPPREGERPGFDYYFLGADRFRRHVEAGDFLEHALVHGNSYGILKSEILGKLNLGQDVLLNVDVQGAATICAQAQAIPQLQQALVTVFITPPSLALLEERLKKRAQDSPEVIARRLQAARHEIAQWVHYDYLIISTSIAEDLRRMQVLMEAEKMRPGRVAPPLCD